MDSHKGGTRSARARAAASVATAAELARRGADIVIVDLKPAGETVQEVQALGRRAVAYQADVSDPDQVADLAGRLTELTGAVDVLVNNAGIFPFENLRDLTFDRFKQIQRIDLDSQFLMTKAVIGGMRDRSRGCIVNLASNSLGRAVPDMRRLVPPSANVRFPTQGDSYTGATTSSSKAKLHRFPPAAAHTIQAVAPHPAPSSR